jgi:hypothetical protein
MGVLLTLVRGRKGPAGAPHVDGTVLRRIEGSAARARYWVKRTPREAIHLLHRARLYDIAAVALSVITGLFAWPVIADGSRLTAQVVLSTLSCLIAATIAVPYATGLHDRVEESIKLCGAYGAIYGELLGAHSRLDPGATPQPPVAELIQRLDDVTTRMDALKLAAPPPDHGQASGD